MTNSKWYETNFQKISNKSNSTINNKKYSIIERKIEDDGEMIKERIAITTDKDYIYIFQFYSTDKDFQELSVEYQTILNTITFDPGVNASNYELQEAGFFTGIFHGLLWIFRWFSSFGEKYVDVWPDNNSGFGYVIGFLVLGGGLRLFIPIRD